MKTLLQKILHWNDRTRTEQEALHRRLDPYRYWTYFSMSFLLCLFPIPLRWLFTFTLSDKEAPGKHHYGWAYDRNFRRFKYRRIKILEIGIGGYDFSIGGQSLNSWQCYFPFGKIIGADIKDRRALQNFRTRIHILDQGNRQSLDELGREEGPFHLIVDDGSHMNVHQLLTFSVLFDHLAEGGIYVIEDVQTSYWKFGRWDGACPGDDEFQGTCMGMFLGVAKYLNHAEMDKENCDIDKHLEKLAKRIKCVEFQHNLIFVHKGRNEDPSNYLSL